MVLIFLFKLDFCFVFLLSGLFVQTAQKVPVQPTVRGLTSPSMLTLADGSLFGRGLGTLGTGAGAAGAWVLGWALALVLSGALALP